MAISRCYPGLLMALAFSPGTLHAQAPLPVHLVLFTHIEDNTPAGILGSPQSRQNYLLYRGRLIAMANLALGYGIPWSLQPDWKILEAALLYEDSTLTLSTNDKNFLRYLKEDLGVVIDPHSHENGGYNYTDVAHLLDSLGVGATTVIGGHIWDPDLPQFQEWDRFRAPVAGERYPWALWRGDILMGSGTPNHVDDPVVSGVWRPRDRYNYFEHDSTANIAAIGQFRGSLDDPAELTDLYVNGVVSSDCMLTSSYHVKPSAIIAPGGIAAIEDTILAPVAAMRDSGLAVPTDFTSLVQTWQAAFGSRGCIYDAEAVSGAGPGDPDLRPIFAMESCSPNPLESGTIVRFSVSRAARIRAGVFDVLGRELGVLVDGLRVPGNYELPLSARGLAISCGSRPRSD